MTPALASFDNLHPGTQVGRYQIIEMLAVGGMAELYLAKSVGMHGFERYSVLKRLPPRLVSEPGYVDMFIDEARIAATLRHPNIAQVYDIGEDSESCFFAMEYIEGTDLHRLFRKLRRYEIDLPLGAALHIIMGICEGLHAAHEARAYDGSPLGLVHRDISPPNAIVTRDGAIKIIDFGIAKAQAQSRRAKTEMGVIKGKYAYMSPEQSMAKAVDRRSDIYSLGIMLFELTTMTRFYGDMRDVEILEKLSNGYLPEPAEHRPGYPPELSGIISKMLARNPEDRYSTARELHQALSNFACRNGISTSPYDLAGFLATLGNYERRASGGSESDYDDYRLARGTEPPFPTADESSSPALRAVSSQQASPLLRPRSQAKAARALSRGDTRDNRGMAGRMGELGTSSTEYEVVFETGTRAGSREERAESEAPLTAAAQEDKGPGLAFRTLRCLLLSTLGTASITGGYLYGAGELHRLLELGSLLGL